ncbi:MAG TPA: hypothetical protein VHN99_09285 [Deinococcales bacterium]|nr:hypothetical protein [Deinococcales bacterium]
MDDAPRVPVIDLTDLYHPYQDVDDNLDLLLAFGLPDVNLLGVILDAHEPFRQPVADVRDRPALWADPFGPREPGFVPVTQLNFVFDRQVPCACGPFTRMRSPGDAMLDATRFQQAGVNLLLRLLAVSPEPVHLLVQGSARPLAVALNREPDLVLEKVAAAHLVLGSANPDFLEWNVALDEHAARRVLDSPLKVNLFPPGGEKDPFTPERHNAYWRLASTDWMRGLDPRLRRYLAFAFSCSARVDYLRALEVDDPPGTPDPFPDGVHLWTTAAWMEITGRRLVKAGPDGEFRLERPRPGGPEPLPHALRPARLEWGEGGRFATRLDEGNGRLRVYDRGDPLANQAALNQAFPALHARLKVPPLEVS